MMTAEKLEKYAIDLCEGVGPPQALQAAALMAAAARIAESIDGLAQTQAALFGSPIKVKRVR